MAAEIAVGIDLGGTKIEAGLVTGEGKVLSDVRVPTEADKDAATVVGNIRAAVRSAPLSLPGPGPRVQCSLDPCRPPPEEPPA